MSSYFANSYIPDLRNGGVEHSHQHQQHYGAAVQVPQQTQSVQQQSQQGGDPCDPNLLRQAVSAHHYGTTGGSQQDMPYPRFPPYNRIDMRNAAYYQHQQEHGSMDGMAAGYRSTSPNTSNMAHMGHTPTPNGHPSTPVVYASCKLQAAAVDHQGSVLDGPDSPPLVESQMHHQMHSQQHTHMQTQQSQHPQQQSQHQHLQAQQQHMMYQQQQQSQTTSQQGQGGMHPQQQQQTQQHQGVVASAISQQQQQGAPQGAASANLPSPLYPWMRSQFGKRAYMYIY